MPFPVSSRCSRDLAPILETLFIFYSVINIKPSSGCSCERRKYTSLIVFMRQLTCTNRAAAPRRGAAAAVPTKAQLLAREQQLPAEEEQRQ